MKGLDAYRRHGGVHEDQYVSSKKSRVLAREEIEREYEARSEDIAAEAPEGEAPLSIHQLVSGRRPRR
jgi:hypothetical protein